MPEFTVELSFEYRSTYRVVAETEEEAMEIAEAHDTLKHWGTSVPEYLAGREVECQGDREYAGDLDTRLFDAQGREIILD
jgi:hypothetical protein